MGSYLDSPLYQQMLAKTLAEGQPQSQYPGQALANTGAQLINALMLKKSASAQEAKQSAGNDALAALLAPQNITSVGQQPTSQVNIPGSGATDISPPGGFSYDNNQDKRQSLAALLKSGTITPDALMPQALQQLGIGPPKQPIKLGKDESLYDPNTLKQIVAPNTVPNPVISGADAAKVGLDPNRSWQMGQNNRYEPVSEAPPVLRDLTPQEVAAHGLPPGTVAQINPKTNEVSIRHSGKDPYTPLTQQEINDKARLAGAETIARNNATNAAGGVGGTGGKLSGDLSTYPQEVQGTIKSMLDGRMAPPSAQALRTPYWQGILNAANAIDPTFDQTSWGTRAAARKDMFGGGKSNQLLTGASTAIQHLGHLYDQIGDVSGAQIPLVGNTYNYLSNAASQASGVPGLPAYNDTLGHLAEETTKFYRGAGGSEADVARNMSNLGANLSTPQKKAGVKNTVDLLYGKLVPMADVYNKAMGTNYPPEYFLSPAARETLKKVSAGTGYQLLGDTTGSAQPQPAPSSANELLRKYGIQ